MTHAIIFPGQGSQSMGMLSDLAGQYTEVRETFQQASDILSRDLWAITQDGPEEELNATINTQPAMLAAGVAVWRIWDSVCSIKPEIMAGHSLGEYTALVCSGALSFADAVDLVAERAQLMQSAVPEGQGAMAALLGLDDDSVSEVCEQAAQGQVVEAVNFNSPGQVVIAGDTLAVERAIEIATDAGAKRVIQLPVSVPSHCALMKPAAEKLSEKLAGITIQSPQIKVLHNVDAGLHEQSESIREALAAQLHSPVLWADTIRQIANDGITKIIELGPGRVLTGLNKRIDRSLSGLCIQDIASLEKALASE